MRAYCSNAQLILTAIGSGIGGGGYRLAAFGALRCYHSVQRRIIRNARFLPRDAMLARYLLCPSVRPSQAGIVSKRLDESRWFLARRLPSAYPTLCYKEIYVYPEIWVLPRGTFTQTPDLRRFCHGKSISLSTKLDVVVDGRAC